jgi:predicted DNA-binding transcriptional regulator AlpA
MARHPTSVRRRRQKPKPARTNGKTQAAPTTPAPVLTEADASQYLGFTVAWLRVRRRDKRGPAFVRAGRAIRYRVADLEAWLIANIVPTRDQKQASS